MSIDILQNMTLTGRDFNEQTQFIVDDFIAEKMITLIYADGGNGKSLLTQTLANTFASKGYQVIYLDFDNPMSVLNERNIYEMMGNHHPEQLKYVHRSKCTLQPEMLLHMLGDDACGNEYKDHVFFIDSLRNFMNVKNDAQTLEMLTVLMNMREAGATIIALHHSNKDGKNYEGSNNIRNSVDNIFQLRKVTSNTHQNTLDLVLHVRKDRASIKDTAVRIDAKNLTLSYLDVTSALMTEEVEEFAHEVKQAIEESESELNKTELLKAVGRKKDDKTARRWLDQFDGVLWKSKKQGGVFTYQLLDVA